MYLASALRFVSDNRTQVLIRTSHKRPPQKRIIKCSLTRIESQLFFFLEGFWHVYFLAENLFLVNSKAPYKAANGRNIAGQQVETTPNVCQDVTCCVRLLTLLHVAACCWELLNRLHTTATRTQQHATLLALQCWELLFHLRLGVIRHGIFWSRDLGRFCRKPKGIFWVLIFVPIRSSPSLEIRSTPL